MEACDCDHLSSPLFTFRRPLNDFCRLSHFVSCNPTSAPWHIWYPPPPLGIRQNDFYRLGTFRILQDDFCPLDTFRILQYRLLSHGHVSYPPVPTSVAILQNDFCRLGTLLILQERLLSLSSNMTSVAWVYQIWYVVNLETSMVRHWRIHGHVCTSSYCYTWYPAVYSGRTSVAWPPFVHSVTTSVACSLFVPSVTSSIAWLRLLVLLFFFLFLCKLVDGCLLSYLLTTWAAGPSMLPARISKQVSLRSVAHRGM